MIGKRHKNKKEFGRIKIIVLKQIDCAKDGTIHALSGYGGIGANGAGYYTFNGSWERGRNFYYDGKKVAEYYFGFNEYYSTIFDKDYVWTKSLRSGVKSQAGIARVGAESKSGYNTGSTVSYNSWSKIQVSHKSSAKWINYRAVFSIPDNSGYNANLVSASKLFNNDSSSVN